MTLRVKPSATPRWVEKKIHRPASKVGNQSQRFPSAPSARASAMAAAPPCILLPNGTRWAVRSTGSAIAAIGPSTHRIPRWSPR